MNMKPKFYFILAAALFTTVAQGQAFEHQLKELGKKRDTTGQIQLLQAWSLSKPTDPELFIAYFNFYINQSRKEMVSLDRAAQEGSSLVVQDTGTGKPVAFLNASIHFDDALLQRGFDKIDQGIALHPTRLDMRFGKIYMLGEAENYEAFTSTIVETIKFGEQIGHAWLWKKDEALKDGAQFFLGSLQDYITTLYNTEDDNLLPFMRQIAATVLQYHPNHVESLSNVALTYMIAGDFVKALPYLQQAEKEAPNDVVILNNIAESYKRMNQKDNAKSYLEKIVRFGNKEESAAAREKIRRL